MKSWGQCPDVELLLAARTCSDSFGVFYERHFAQVLAFSRRRVAGPEEASDLAAETFAAALGSVPRFQPGPAPVQAWLFAIARHKLSEALRRNQIHDEARRALAMQPRRRSRFSRRSRVPRRSSYSRRYRQGSVRRSRRTTSTSAVIPRSLLSFTSRKAQSGSA